MKTSASLDVSKYTAGGGAREAATFFTFHRFALYLTETVVGEKRESVTTNHLSQNPVRQKNLQQVSLR